MAYAPHVARHEQQLWAEWLTQFDPAEVATTFIPVVYLGAAEAHIGSVGGASSVVEIELVVDDGAAYADGDVLAITQAFAGAARVNAGTAVIQSIIALDKDDQGVPFDLVFLRTEADIGALNAAAAPTDAAAEEIIGIVSILNSDFKDLANSQIATIQNIGLVIEAEAATTGIWIAAIARGIATYTAAAGITIKVGVLQD